MRGLRLAFVLLMSAAAFAASHISVELAANGLVFVQAKINGHPGWFILDNASQGFTVDPEFARHIFLQSDGSAIARGGGSDLIRAGVVHDVEIGLAGLNLTHRNLVVIPLKGLEPVIGHQVDGIIGSRLFDDYVVEIDYEGRTVSIWLPNERPPQKGIAFPVRIDAHGFPFIDASIVFPGAGALTAGFLIDGGANTFADIYKPYADAHQLPPQGMKLLDDPGSSSGGTTLARDGRAERIRIGPYSIENPPVSFAQDTEGLMAVTDQAGLIGAEFLERFRVVFDSPAKRIWLTPNRSYATPAEYDQSGLRLRAEGPGFHRIVVGRVVTHSPAAEAGIAPGDVIESIDESHTRELTVTDVRHMLCRPGASYSLGLLRGNRQLRVTLKLRPLI